jgi:lysophospholipase
MWKWEAENPKGVIVIVHGAAEHHGRYKWLIEKWRSFGLHVIMGDLPGQGTTSRKKRGHIQSFNEYINELERWIEEASKYGLPIFLLGHSMGGLTIIRALQEKELPVEAAILSSPCLGLIDNPSLPLNLITKGINHIFPAIRVDSKLSVQKATRNKEVHQIDANDSLYVTKVSIRWYRELVNAMKLAFLNIEKLQDIPILLLQSGEDKIVDKNMVQKWFDQLNCSEKMYKEWNGLYHEIFNEPERAEVFHFASSFINTHIEIMDRQ